MSALRYRSKSVTYPRATAETFIRAMDVLGARRRTVPFHDVSLVQRVEEAEQQARISVGHDDYEAFEEEFMRIVESEAARKIIEEGL